MNEEQSPAVGVSYAARRLGVSESRVRQMIEQGQLDVYPREDGIRGWQIKRGSLEKRIAERKQQSSSALRSAAL
jgi:hypothetical protein